MELQEPVILPLRQQSGPHAAPKFDVYLEARRLKSHLRLLAKWWFRRHVPYQPVFVIATCRSGSNLLLSYLQQQSQVAMLPEVLCPRLPIGPRREGLPREAALQHIRLCLQGERTPVRGAKLMIHQLRNCSITLNHLRDAFPTAKYVILYRQSLAEQFVSQKLAVATNQFVLRPGQEQRPADIYIDPAELRGYCDDIRSGYRDVLSHRWLADRSVLLSYEELTADPQHWLSQHLCPLLGVPYTPPESRLRKQNTFSLAEQISNYRQVATMLNGPLCQQQHVFPRPGRLSRKAA